MGCMSTKRQTFHSPTRQVPLLTPVAPAVKIIFCGKSAVGKTSICQRCKDDTFSKHYQATLTPCYQARTLNYGDRQVKLKLWDTAGEQRFRSVNRIFFRGADIAVLVFDITNRQSFNQMQFWFGQLKDKVNREGLVLCLVGNKKDMEDRRTVSISQGEAKAAQHGCIYRQTSAMNGQGIQRMLQDIVDSHQGKNSS